MSRERVSREHTQLEQLSKVGGLILIEFLKHFEQLIEAVIHQLITFPFEIIVADEDAIV